MNAVADFNALLDRLVDERNVLSAADTLKQQAVYVTNVRSNAVTVEKRRAKERANPINRTISQSVSIIWTTDECSTRTMTVT